MVGSTEGVGVPMLGPWPEDYVKVIAGKGFQPPQDHSLGFLHRLDALQSMMICSEDELSLGEVVSPLLHEVDSSKDFSFV